VVVSGRFGLADPIELLLEGNGRAEVWLQSEGELAPGLESKGVLLPHASIDSTVAVPAAHPSLIAVGATVSRSGWIDRKGESVTASSAGQTPWVVGAPVSFSSAGPNLLGGFKPDVVAPGAFVVAALSTHADPRVNPNSVFGGGLGCGRPLDCQVVSDRYAVNGGTSMAAPVVAGVAALLLEVAPRLTQPEVLALLRAGARPPEGVEALAWGGGGLQVRSSFVALERATAPDPLPEPSAASSRLAFAQDHVLADPARPLAAQLWLRDALGDPTQVAAPRLDLRVVGGALTEPLRPTSVGLYEFAVSAQPGASVLKLDLLLDGKRWLSADLSVERVPALVRRDRDKCSVGWMGRHVQTGADTTAVRLALTLGIVFTLRRGARRYRT
jgi:hypothetical protein